MQKSNVILKVEHDLEQCTHIPWRRGRKHSYNHLRQNNFIEVHTPYPKKSLEKRCGERTKVETNASQSKVTSISGWKSLKKRGNQFQQVGGEGEKILWFHQMGLLVCSKLMYVLLKHIPLHEQGFVHGVIMLMKVGQDLKSIPNIYNKLE